MEQQKEITRLLQHAHSAVLKALNLAPKHCNLSDDLDAVAETLDNLKTSAQRNEYDNSGMAR